MVETVNLIIKKKSRFYQEFQQVEDDGITPIPLTGKRLKCQVKASFNTTLVIHDLTEVNGGMIQLNALLGKFAMTIPSDETDIVPNNAVYDIKLETIAYPTTEDEAIIEGKIEYTEGVTA